MTSPLTENSVKNSPENCAGHFATKPQGRRIAKAHLGVQEIPFGPIREGETIGVSRRRADNKGSEEAPEKLSDQE